MNRDRELAENLQAVEDRIRAACAAVGRPRAEVALIAVSKTWPVADVTALHSLGITDFGENRDREAAEKAAALPHVRWHFVGAVQTNKARSVASYADVVHSVDRLPLVPALGAGADRAGRVVEVLVQVSLDDDPARGGAAPGEVARLAAAVANTKGLALTGLMAVAPRDVEPAVAFARLREIAEGVRRDHPRAVVLSAGMSGDLEAAVAAGANALRVGTALFGHRSPPAG